jgi:uncharacterized membrane protein SpoIIM required for sporulation
MAAPVTRSVAFRRDREASWRRLESLCARVESRGIGTLGERELLELPTLHRAAVSALSVARAISLDRALLEYLEALTARSHTCVHGIRQDLGRALFEFATRTFPAAVRAAAPQVMLAGLALLVGVATGFAMTSADVDTYDAFVGPEMAQGRDPTASTEDLREMLYADEDFGDALVTFATFLFQHNTQVGILCFGLGFALGIPVLWLLFTNGLSLGAMSALHHRLGLSVDWWGWVLPHGVTELLAIVLCGAAGLLQGRAVLMPGRRTRSAALRAAGREAGVIVLGCVGLFLVAALLEGLFRQLVHSVPLRYSVVAATGLCWLGYFLRCGRSAR